MMEKIYIDANILVYWLLPSRKETTKLSNDFMVDVQSGRYKGVITFLALSEMVNAIRCILAKRDKPSQAWQETINYSLNRIYKLGENFTVAFGFPGEMNSGRMDFGSISTEATTLIMNHPGRRKTGHWGSTYDGLSPMDALHAVLASRLNCDRIATFDNDFDEISDYIPRLNVRKEYGGAGLSK